MSYDDLVARFIGQPPEHVTPDAPSDARYFVKVQGFWNKGTPGTPPVAAFSDDGWRAFKPLCNDFIRAPDDSFVGE
jgi:hypothetical protein